jgi:hypothetical protein
MSFMGRELTIPIPSVSESVTPGRRIAEAKGFVLLKTLESYGVPFSPFSRKNPLLPLFLFSIIPKSIIPNGISFASGGRCG